MAFISGTPAGRTLHWAWGLFLLSPCVVAAFDLNRPPPEEDTSTERALPTISARPTSRPRRLPPAPQIISFSPTKEIIAGGTITFRGSDLRPSDFVARLGMRRPVTLTVLRSTSTAIRVRVPDSAVTRGSPLTVQYAGSQVVTLAESFRVYPQPNFSNIVFREGPHIGLPTEMEIAVSNFSGLENAKLVWWSDCWINGKVKGSLPGSRRISKIPLTISISMNDPALGSTEQLMVLSGRRCVLDVSVLNTESRFSTGLSIQLPTVARYTIGNTWELQGYSTSSGKNFEASVTGLPGTCEPLSVGTAGSFPIGVVRFENDISFQLRNGLIDLSCGFMTSPRLRVKDGWQITEVDWVSSRSRGNHCYPVYEYVESAPGIWASGPELNPEYLDRAKTLVDCVVDSKDPAKNSHLFRAVLRKIVLVGPPRQSWRAAFR